MTWLSAASHPGITLFPPHPGISAGKNLLLVLPPFFLSLHGMPDPLAVILLGIIEGITEFLPVSSTGHLLIAEQWLHIRQSDLFNVVIQAGAVIAVIPLFHRRFHQFLFQWQERKTQLYAAKLLLAFVITGAIGVIIDKKGFKLPDRLIPIAIALMIGGVAFVLIELWLRGKTLKDEVTWTMAVAVGFGQILAIIFPGASRSGTTILLCLLLGLARPAATEFCFIVGIPTMLAASALKIFKALHHPPPGTAPEHWSMVGLGFIVSAIVSFIAVKWLLRYIQTHTFTVFGWYRIALAILIMFLLLAGIGC
jgi:undecaprenyl-diphosphatase